MLLVFLVDFDDGGWPTDRGCGRSNGGGDDKGDDRGGRGDVKMSRS